MWWGHHEFWFFPFGILFFIFLVWFTFFMFCSIRNYGRYRRAWHDDDDAEIILRRRLANGEIDEAEYQRLKDILKKH